jgi:hypothetical protein
MRLHQASTWDIVGNAIPTESGTATVVTIGIATEITIEGTVTVIVIRMEGIVVIGRTAEAHRLAEDTHPNTVVVVVTPAAHHAAVAHLDETTMLLPPSLAGEEAILDSWDASKYMAIGNWSKGNLKASIPYYRTKEKIEDSQSGAHFKYKFSSSVSSFSYRSCFRSSINYLAATIVYCTSAFPLR